MSGHMAAVYCYVHEFPDGSRRFTKNQNGLGFDGWNAQCYPLCKKADIDALSRTQAAELEQERDGEANDTAKPLHDWEGLNAEMDAADRRRGKFRYIRNSTRESQLESKVPGCGDCAHNGRYLCDTHGPPAPEEKDAALRWIMRAAEAAKEPCGHDPESHAGIRNGYLASIAQAAAHALGMVHGPSFAAAAETNGKVV